jgi:predicted nucleic acid-binding protein
MNIIDSSLWLEYFAGTLRNRGIVGMIEDPSSQYVPSICIYEVFKRILVDKNESDALACASFMQNAVVISVTPQVAMLAARLGKEHMLPMADSIIYATSKIHNAEIYTQDKHFESLDNVHYFPKP